MADIPSGARLEYGPGPRNDARTPWPVVVAIAAHVGKTRLIDNAVFAPPPA